MIWGIKQKGKIGFLLFFVLLSLLACQQDQKSLIKTRFDQLPQWGADDLKGFVDAFLKSCSSFEEPGKGGPFFVKKELWVGPCAVLAKKKNASVKELRQTIETLFVPYKIKGEKGFLTGYYEASLRASRKKTKRYGSPIWGVPKDLIFVDPALFGKEKGGAFYGKRYGKSLVPYDTRAEIAAGSLAGRAKPIFWAQSDVDVFFLEAQGSGRLFLEDGPVVFIDHAAKNGWPYHHIGPKMLEEGYIKRPASALAMKDWLKAHSQKARALMNENPSLIFFEERRGNVPMGFGNIPLTPQRSVAIDALTLPIGAPLWIVTAKRQRLTVAQDVGSAIKGAARADLFMGTGQRAEEFASQIQERALFYILLPRDYVLP